MKIRPIEALLAKAARGITTTVGAVADRSTLLHPELHPEIRVMMGLSRLTGHAGLTGGSVHRSRKLMAQGIRVMMAKKPTQVATIRDLDVPGAEGPLPARHYVSVPLSKKRPLLVFFHGGGFALGDLETHDEACRVLCAEGGFDVLSVAYRLAPEHPFPAGVEDGVAAVRWARDNAGSLGADPERIGVGGDSAGGTLAAVTSLLLRDAGDKPPALQLLIYPAVDRSRPYPSAEEFGSQGLVLTRDDLNFFNRTYVRDPKELLDFRASPLLAQSHTNLPPAVVVTATCDILRDEVDAYAQVLEESGVHVKHLRMQGMVHGFIHMNAVSEAANKNLLTIARATAHMFAYLARSKASEGAGATA